ncbi:MAG: hypothetical protein IT262_14970 [Saprospiraceae bacterium]|nr:hypothetical protein [Saprospiraceae bacterium]
MWPGNNHIASPVVYAGTLFRLVKVLRHDRNSVPVYTTLPEQRSGVHNMSGNVTKDNKIRLYSCLFTFSL